jgi:cytoskeletal protein CcmA (bactofilin family)
MFKKEEQGGETIIAAGVRVEGEFVSKGKLIIDGDVAGNIKTEDDINIGEQAKIVANISAQNGIIAGEIKGDIRIKGRLDILRTANVKGDVSANILSIEAGANLNGKCAVGENATAEKPNGRVAREKEAEITER